MTTTMTTTLTTCKGGTLVVCVFVWVLSRAMMMNRVVVTTIWMFTNLRKQWSCLLLRTETGSLNNKKLTSMITLSLEMSWVHAIASCGIRRLLHSFAVRRRTNHSLSVVVLIGTNTCL